MGVGGRRELGVGSWGLGEEEGIGSWELGVGGRRGSWELGVGGWGKKRVGSWELGVGGRRGWGDGEMGGWGEEGVNTDLLLYFSALSTLHSALREALSSRLGTRLLGVQATELRTYSALLIPPPSSHSALSTFYSALTSSHLPTSPSPHPLPPQHSALSTQHLEKH
uniref:Uncharacterized protein n=1 Tax=Desertifilum tharense IPPAS B-1220 TaxID=1781255 RepID=A0ACD5GT68_9CYAN